MVPALRPATRRRVASKHAWHGRRGGPGTDEHGRSRTWRKITDVLGPGRPGEEEESRPRRGRTTAPATPVYRPAKAWMRPWMGRFMPG